LKEIAMARITTRDCERFVPNRFELVLLAAERVHQLATGAEPLIAGRDEPASVLALREIASGRIETGRLREALVRRFSRVDRDMPFDEPSREWLVPGFLSDGSHEGPPDGRAPARVH